MTFRKSSTPTGVTTNTATLALAAAATITLTACGGAAVGESAQGDDEGEVSIALLLSGSASAGGWNESAAAGLQALEDAGFKTSLTENLAPADIPNTIDSYARSGYDLIFGNGFEYGSVISEMGPKHPDTNFFATTAQPQADMAIPENVGYLNIHFSEIAYLDGALTALLSDSNKVGVVGGGDNPTQKGMLAAFKAGAEAAVPGTTAMTVLSGSYNDPARGKATAHTMTGQGVDVISHFADTTGVGAINGAVERGATVVGYYGDQSDISPSQTATSIRVRLDNIVESLGEMVANDEFPGGEEWDPGLSAIWEPVYKDSDHNSQLVDDDTWAEFMDLWASVETGATDVPTP